MGLGFMGSGFRVYGLGFGAWSRDRYLAYVPNPRWLVRDGWAFSIRV